MKPNAIRGTLAALLAAAALIAVAAPGDKAPTLANAAMQVTKEQDSLLRKNLAERLPSIGRIDEISRTPMAGLFEVRLGTDLFYTDADGANMFQGQIIDT